MKSRKSALTGIVMSILFVAQSVVSNSFLNAQDSTRPYQITFITPMGTNGMLSQQSVNYLSMNIIAGYNGGLEGIEVGGVANIIEHNMSGTQVAGLANMVKGDMHGMQVAGFSNLVQGKVEGLMVGGFTNHASQGGKLIQIAGFSNQSTGNTEGAQVAGFANMCTDSSSVAQIAGFANTSNGSVKSAQIAGFANYAGGTVEGIQMVGFANSARNLEGAQISGFINRAKHVHGFQLGIINSADSFAHGVPIGLFSHVKHGLRKGAIQINEMGWLEGRFLTGVNRFYNVFSLGISPLPGRQGWSFGYGIGSTIMAKPQSDITIDLVSYHINEGEIWTDAMNNLFRLSANYVFKPNAGHFGITAGPSINLMVSGKKDYYGENFHSITPPYTLLEDQGSFANSALWAGGQIGVIF